MIGHGTKYGQKMEQAIAALISHRSVEAAARAAGIGTNTLSRWMKQPEFQTTLQEARRNAFSQAIGRLQDAADPAVTTLLKMMLASNERTRLRAALAVLDGGAKAYTMEALEARVAKLERLAGLAMRSHEISGDLTRLGANFLRGPAAPAQIAAPKDSDPASEIPPTADTSETAEDADD